MIAVSRYFKRLIPHRSWWQKAFVAEAKWISQQVDSGIVQLEHIGSTSVPNLRARPVIDIGIEMESLEAIRAMIKPLVRFGYTFFGQQGRHEDFLFVRQKNKRQLFFLYVSVLGSYRVRQYCQFRDCLRVQSALRREYEAIKRCANRECGEDRDGYRRIKSVFVRTILLSINAGLPVAIESSQSNDRYSDEHIMAKRPGSHIRSSCLRAIECYKRRHVA